MNSVHYLHDDIAVIGWSCRLPGARSVTDLWSLLLEGRCSVSSVPPDRFPLERFGHPGRNERGKSYTWAAGVLDDIWGFDPSVFGISPREAQQMDPQQRILLQLTWEALEDAGIRPSSIAGSEAGVFVGASQSDYGHAFFSDHAVADAHFATGTALAILPNRISYIFDLRGPSLAIDTACSSSLVALHHAVEALRAGRIDTAIVGGINIIISPASFIAFSQASMLSPHGLCKAFSAKADGFVRAEGGAVLVLRKAAHAQGSRNPVHGLILASDVNSDGRTNGISLPSLDAQEALLQRIYSRSGIAPDRLAFVEAHGTGTAAGDPIEAAALGRSIGRERSSPLLIGSVKTNIGHLEPASGLAGVLKAMLALNHGILPRSLHFDEPNPNIDFEQLNVQVCGQSVLLPSAAERCAGVNSFGFGGTNAHVIVGPGHKPEPPASDAKASAGFFVLSAESKPALIDLADTYARRVAASSDQETAVLAAATAHRREHMRQRIAIASSRSDTVATVLNAFIAGADHPQLTAAGAIGDDLPVAFVYSGNGSQWLGMGLAAYRNNPQFRAQFEMVDGFFRQYAGWSLREALFSDALKERLPLTSVAQPLIFAIQSAATAALRARGLRPAAVLGHSVGEVAAAHAAGILDLRTAVKVIHSRSTHQELTKGKGRMAAVLASPEKVEALAKAVGDIEIAARNSPRGVTIAGTREAIAAFKALARSEDVLLVDLDLDYPFHTALMGPVERPLIADLKNIALSDAEVPFVSTVTGEPLPGSRLDGRYWWRNVREPVRFADAVRMSARLGARYFVEIGPRGTLLKHIADSLEGQATGFATTSVLERDDSDVDPFDVATAKALVNGARIDLRDVFGADPGPGVALPRYPWQQQPFRFIPTPEALASESERHPFAGARNTPDDLEWRAHIDTVLFPELDDHAVGEQTIFPGMGFLEIAMSVARQWLRTESATIAEFEILKPLDLTKGETREVLTRVSPGSNTVEIFSRPRLSHMTWLLNCRGKMLHPTTDPCEPPPRPRDGRMLSADQLYRIAAGGGLNYGPAFRLARHAIVHDGNLITVELAPGQPTDKFLLDPVRLDCCTHSMVTLFPKLRAEERGVTYIPVRCDEYALHRPGTVPERSVMEVLDSDERSIFANFYIFDGGDELIATLRGVRCQATAIRRHRTIETVALIETLAPIDGEVIGAVGVDAAAGAVIASARTLGLAASEPANEDVGTLLIEGWATAAAYEIACGLAEADGLDADALIADGRLPQPLRPWLINIMEHLTAAELASSPRMGFWLLKPGAELPAAASVVKALAIEHPERAAELLLAAAATELAGQASASRAIPPAAAEMLTTALFDFYDSADRVGGQISSVLAKLLQETPALWPRGRALRVLQLGYAPLVDALAARGNLQLTVLEPDRRRYERARLKLPGHGAVTLVGPDHASALERYDLIVSVGALHRIRPVLRTEELKAALAPNGLALAIEPRPSLFADLVFGIDPDWFDAGAADHEQSPLQSGESWALALENAGFTSAETMPVACGAQVASLVVAEVAEEAAAATRAGEQDAASAPRSILVIDPAPDTPLAAAFGEAPPPVVRPTPADLSDYTALAPDIVVLAPPPRLDDPVEDLARRCMDIKTCAETMLEAPGQLWLIFAGALASSKSPVDPAETGAWAFSRTLANELRKLDIRRIDIAPGLDAAFAAKRIGEIVRSGSAETDFMVEADAVRAVRVQQLQTALDRRPGTPAPAAALKRRAGAGPRLAWQPGERLAPSPGQVEIGVEATGLNFRDLMWTLGLLPDDMLEDGFTGPTLGLECAGQIVRVGGGVKTFKPGDRVVALAASSFATHVTVPASQVAKLPVGLSFAAGATIPVAFLTAYYSLVMLARLQWSEWLLVHGGAGGVGMAAIQVALSRGAKVIATAGSRAKRDLLKMLGVSHVLDSRSTGFVDEVRAITGSGVDVVLNSLAGEAMERSLACLRPFGRFVELGKRDYVTNTHVGLRPFRKNLSYFGVDVDQLVRSRQALGERAFGQVMAGFEKGAFTPLPYTTFAAGSAWEAFDLMQHSSHVGKIVVLPPRAGTVRAARPPFVVSAEGTHVVTGAFGGFGLEAARWLADRGARHLVMLGRSGAATAEAKAALADLTGRGIRVIAEACDVADLRAVEKLFEKIHATLPPVAGILHAAMVLDDAIVPNLDAGRFRAVFAPKVRGAENLDLVSRGLKLDYFVLFSSFTTLIGNPGQGNYVAANAYMEGLARRRRQQGLPALAIGWGPITDVGAVARSEKLLGGLQKLAGVGGLQAREALDLMAQALEQPADQVATAAMTVAPVEGTFDADRLPVLRSPTYDVLTSRDGAQGQRSEGEGAIDLRVLLQTESIDVVRRRVSDVIVTQLAHVLHAREDDISRVRPLSEIGLDSLMALELVMNLERAFGTPISLAAAVGTLTLSGVADQILAQFSVEHPHEEAVISTLAEQHLAKVEAGQLDALRDMVATGNPKTKRLLA